MELKHSEIVYASMETTLHPSGNPVREMFTRAGSDMNTGNIVLRKVLNPTLECDDGNSEVKGFPNPNLAATCW